MPERGLQQENHVRADAIQSDEHALSVAAAFADILREGAAQRDLDRTLPRDAMAIFAQRGLGTLNVRHALGGPGVTCRTLLATIRLIAAADASVAQIALTHWAGIEMLQQWASPPLRDRLLLRVLDGDILGNASKDARTSKHRDRSVTRISQDGNRISVSGEKVFSTGSLLADWLYVAARDGQSGEKDVVAFIDKNRPGLAIHDDWDGIGQRTTASGRVTLDSVVLRPDEYFEMTQTDPSLSILFSAVTHLLHSGIQLGLGDGALAETLEILRNEATPPRGSDAASAVEDPLTLSALGESVIAQHSAESAALRAADKLDAIRTQGSALAGEALVAVCEAKIVTERFALGSGTALFELGGARVATRRRNLDRFWRDARTHSLHDASRWKTVTLGQAALNGRRPDPFTLGHPFSDPFNLN